jgi:hypothetical protein
MWEEVAAAEWMQAGIRIYIVHSEFTILSMVF